MSRDIIFVNDKNDVTVFCGPEMCRIKLSIIVSYCFL